MDGVKVRNNTLKEVAKICLERANTEVDASRNVKGEMFKRMLHQEKAKLYRSLSEDFLGMRGRK